MSHSPRAWFLILVLLLAVSGCSSPASKSPGTQAPANSAPEPVTPTTTSIPTPTADEIAQARSLADEGRTLLGAGKLVDAAAKLAEAAALNPRDKDIVNDLALVQIKQGNWPVAIEAGKKAIAIDPSYPPALFNLGRALYGSKNYSDARTYLAKAYDLNKQQVEPGWYLALTLEALGDKAGATQLLGFLFARFPTDGDVAGALAEVTGGLLWKRPAGQPYALTGDLLVRPNTEGTCVEAVDHDGRVRWQTPVNQKIQAIRENREARLGEVVFAGGDIWLIDFATGKVLGQITTMGSQLSGATWVNPTLLYTREDIWGPVPAGGGKYYYTEYVVYDVTRATDGTLAFQPRPEKLRGGHTSWFSADGHLVVLSNRDSAPYTAVQDGNEVGRLDASPTTVAVATDGSEIVTIGRAYQVSGFGPHFEVRWQQTVPTAMSLKFLPQWDAWAVAVQNGSFVVLDGQGKTLFKGSGYPKFAADRYLYESYDSSSMAYDRTGKVVASIPSSRLSLTANEQWVYFDQADGPHIVALSASLDRVVTNNGL